MENETMRRVVKDARGGLAAIAAGCAMLTPFQAEATDFTLKLTNFAGNGVGGSIMYLQHTPGALEGLDIYDGSLANQPPLPNPDAPRLQVYTSPYNDPLIFDSRDTDSASIFQGYFRADGNGPINSQNRLRLAWIDLPIDSSYSHIFSMHLDGAYTANGLDYDLTGDVNDIIAGGDLFLPGVANLPLGVNYGTFTLIETAPPAPEVPDSGNTALAFAAASGLIALGLRNRLEKSR